MGYFVRLTDRALRDLEAIYEFIQADCSDSALVWFNELAEAIYSLEKCPERGSFIPEGNKVRQLLFGKKPSTYRIIYAVDGHNRAVNIVHIRHGARASS